MSKLPFLQFYPADWLRDTRPLSLAAKGAWIDLLCTLHHSPTRGTLALPLAGWARSIGASEAEFSAIHDELKILGVLDSVTASNGLVTLSSRRMMREKITSEQTRLRVQNLRMKRACNADVTPKKTEDRRQKTEQRNTEAAPPLPFSSDAFKSAWEDWQAHRKQNRFPALKPKTLAARFDEFSGWGEAKTIQAIRESIKNGWRGIFEPKGGALTVAAAQPLSAEARARLEAF